MWDKISKYFSNSSNTKSAEATYFYPSTCHSMWTERNYSSLAHEGYMKNPVVHRAIMMIVHGASSVPIKLFSNTNGKKIPFTNHPLLTLLNRPNPLYSGREFMEQIYYYKLISGNAYVLALIDNNKPFPTEMVVLRPDRVTIIPGDTYIPSGYKYQVDNHSITYNLDHTTGRSQILHLHSFHPLSDWYGLSSIDSASYSIDQHNNAGAWNQALLQNGARPSGAFTVKNSDGHLSQEEFHRLKSTLENVVSGPGNAGRPILLEGGIEWTEMSLSPKDMDFIEAKNSAAREIALALGMPPQLLGIPGDNTYTNLAEARIALWEQTILPLVENTISALDHWLKCFHGLDVSLWYDPDSVLALVERRESLWSKLENANFMTRDEKRAIVGLSPLNQETII